MTRAPGFPILPLHLHENLVRRKKSDSGWYYVENDNRIGPIERSEVERLISQGTIRAQSMVWREGMSGWEEAGRHFSFAGGVSGPPPISAGPPVVGGAQPMAAAAMAPAGGHYAGAPARGFGEAISTCFGKYVVFQGRASRSEFWFFTLFTILLGLATAFVDVLIFGPNDEVSPINAIASLAVFLPSLAVGVRRLHDINRTGWWIGSFYLAGLLIGLLLFMIMASNPYGRMDTDAVGLIIGLGGIAMLIYGIVMLVFMCQKGDPGPNRFG